MGPNVIMTGSIDKPSPNGGRLTGTASLSRNIRGETISSKEEEQMVIALIKLLTKTIPQSDNSSQAKANELIALIGYEIVN